MRTPKAWRPIDVLSEDNGGSCGSYRVADAASHEAYGLTGALVRIAGVMTVFSPGDAADGETWPSVHLIDASEYEHD